MFEHIALSGLDGIAMAIAIPAGIGSATPGGSPVHVNLANLGRALPSLAVIGSCCPSPS